MKKIPLTKGRFAIVDNIDFKELSIYRWTFQGEKTNNNGYAIRDTSRGRVFMHRVILNAKKGKICDHINGNGLDNRRNNLRICTSGDNNKNSKVLRKNNTTGYKGVSFVAKNKKPWFAQIQVDGKNMYLGCFENIKDAARAYNKAAMAYHGIYAKINNIN